MRSGPSPDMLHSLRGHGCQLVLVRPLAKPESAVQDRLCNTRSACLSEEWFAAVFDHILELPEHDGGNTLERFLQDTGINPVEALAFACTEAGASSFTAADVGLVIAPRHEQVWHYVDQPEAEENLTFSDSPVKGKDLSVPLLYEDRQVSSESFGVCLQCVEWGGSRRIDLKVHMAGADISCPRCPTVRQLAWLHKVCTHDQWCTCLWLTPAPQEFTFDLGDLPTSLDRAVLTKVASRTVSTYGHPPWSTQDSGCRVFIGECVEKDTGLEALVACPDWTRLEPFLKRRSKGRKPVQLSRIITDLPEVTMYLHCLDVGVAQVIHSVELQGRGARDRNLGARITHRRFVSLARNYLAAADLTVTVLDHSGGSELPDVCIRSSLQTADLPEGWRLESVDSLKSNPSTLIAEYVYVGNSMNNVGKVLKLTAAHRFVKDDGRGEVQLAFETSDSPDCAVVVTRDPSCCAIDVVFNKVRRGTRYTVEKVVNFTVSRKGLCVPMQATKDRSDRLPTPMTWGIIEETEDPTLPEIEADHRAHWCHEWDKADIEIAGTRKAARCQRNVRLFRFHQVSLGFFGSGLSEPRVPPLVRQLFQASPVYLGEAPSKLVKERITVKDPRSDGGGPLVRINPKVPSSVRGLRFNAALANRWHRFTLTHGKVHLLVQGPIPPGSHKQLYSDEIKVQPKFLVMPSTDYEDSVMTSLHKSHGDEVLGVNVRPSPWQEVQVQHALTDLGRPDGSTGGFYSLMRRTRAMRAEIVQRLFSDENADFREESLRNMLMHSLAHLQSIPRPPAWRRPDVDTDPLMDHHMLEADSTTRVRVVLEYEKNELTRDLLFLEEPRFIVEEMRCGGEDIVVMRMTVTTAKKHCARLSSRGCRAFTFQGKPSEDEAVEIHFKAEWVPHEEEGQDWTTYQMEKNTESIWGEDTLWKRLREQHNERFPGQGSEQDWFGDWEFCVAKGVKALSDTVSPDNPEQWFREVEEGLLDSGAPVVPKPFRNMMTDRDGTTNNYCDRYASCVQSAYNAAFLSHFVKSCTENAVFITSAPLGGRPSAEGLMELSVMPSSIFTFTGSKGREYFDSTAQRVLETEVLSTDQREKVDELHRRLLALCGKPGNTKFLGIGSGLQRKYGGVTMARNDPASTIPEQESRRFMLAVRKVKEDLDPDGIDLEMHDTGSDLELAPRRSAGGEASFDKGNGVKSLDRKLKLRVEEGPNIVCGDTDSDVKMIEATLALMCGEPMLKGWLWQMELEEAQEKGEPEPEHLDPDPFEDTEELQRAREAGKKLIVLFVVSRGEHVRKPKLAQRVRRLCELAGAQCAILPSPDVLVASLAMYANIVTRATPTPFGICSSTPDVE